MSATRTLLGIGIAGVVVGIAIWAVADNATGGILLLVVGVTALAVAALRNRSTAPNDPDAARRNQQADEQRERGATDAGTENLEDRPPATGA